MTSIVKIDKDLVKNDISNYFAYEAKNIIEVNGGTVGYTFSIDNKYFLKIYDTELVMTKRCTEKLLEQLTVLDILQNNTSLADKICYPIKNVDNQYFYAHDNIIGVLFNFIEGEAIGFGNKYSESEIIELSEIVKTLHKIDSEQFNKLCPKEEFNLEFCDELKLLIENSLIDLPNEFYEECEKYKEVIIERLIEIKNLAKTLQQMSLPFVLCHTDIHGGNIMRNEQGKIFLVDWENMILAPKEADLFMFCESEYFHRFNNNYDKPALLYYLMRRDLEDIWEFIKGILYNEYDEIEQTDVLVHLKRILNHLSVLYK